LEEADRAVEAETHSVYGRVATDPTRQKKKREKKKKKITQRENEK
jgi:hypothetical protein